MNKTLHTLYISYDGMTDPLGQSQVIPYLKNLSTQGYKIHLISCEKKQRYASQQNAIRILLEKYEIIWYPIVYHKSPPVLSTLYDIFNIYTTAKRIVKQHKIALVHCRSYISALIGLQLKRGEGIPFIFDMRGFWADERIEGNIWKLSNPFYRWIYTYFKRKESSFITECSTLISLTEKGAKEIFRTHPDAQAKTIVIPCCCDFDFYQKDSKSNILQLKTEMHIVPDAFVLSYVGSLGTWYMVSEMMEFYALLSKKLSSSYFLIITLDNPEIIYTQAKLLSIPSDRLIVKSATKNEITALISLSNASVFFIKPTFSKTASSPTKYAELVAMNIPVICNNNIGDMEQMTDVIGSGVSITAFNETEMNKAIDVFLEKKDTFEGIREKGKPYLDISVANERYLAAYTLTLSTTQKL